LGRSSKPEMQSVVVVEAEDFTDREQIEMDITEARGFVSSLAKKWQCSWSAARHRIKRHGLDEHLAEEKAAYREQLQDIAEYKVECIMRRSDNMETVLRAAQFVLTTQGRQRGYLPKMDVNGYTQEDLNKTLAHINKSLGIE
jgi:hypothetical protein